ncbi:hypothetical protein AOQ84DRAFT_205977 [Glonium stellatum]|uniref:Uncharacterized protein n=1 Tax=Glonium stellatum TaxID=574774 RepID=A0A8E2F5P1_9PEZI|nr:hypothetical protein AOQ84DRAFT_205977 [Glonium stellatum]
MINFSEATSLFLALPTIYQVIALIILLWLFLYYQKAIMLLLTDDGDPSHPPQAPAGDPAQSMIKM